MKSATFSCFGGAFSPALGENAPNHHYTTPPEICQALFYGQNAQKKS